jgi:hypothetical protein
MSNKTAFLQPPELIQPSESPFDYLRVRYEKRADIHEAFLSLGCTLICWRFLRVDWVAGGKLALPAMH